MSAKFGRLEFSRKNLSFSYQKLHNPSKRKVELPCFEYTWLSNDMEMPWYSLLSFLFLFFCLEAMLGQDTYETTSATVMVIFSKVLFRKLLITAMLKFILNNCETHNSSILKDALRLKILWTWIKIRANSFIKTLVNIMKRKSTKVPWTLSLAKKMRPCTSKNITPK